MQLNRFIDCHQRRSKFCAHAYEIKFISIIVLMQSVDDVAVAENISMSHDVLLPDTIEPQVCDY